MPNPTLRDSLLAEVEHRAQVEALLLERSQAYIERERALVARHQALFLCEKAFSARDQALSERKKERILRLRQEQQFHLTVTDQEEIIRNLQRQVRRLQSQCGCSWDDSDYATSTPSSSSSTQYRTLLDDDNPQTPPVSPTKPFTDANSTTQTSLKSFGYNLSFGEGVFNLFQEPSDDDGRSQKPGRKESKPSECLEWDEESEINEVWKEHHMYFMGFE
ncbi:hypothetical protein BDZ89DRAFT_1126453 [Hymenopellis radicata]|nr:hypothetical protein BDZ89DRAFT_1126453 [Hymenopellis radicata]